jgi:ABC-type long-subunit fatty acid transport system fused permease/ATPase subunit
LLLEGLLKNYETCPTVILYLPICITLCLLVTELPYEAKDEFVDTSRAVLLYSVVCVPLYGTKFEEIYIFKLMGA